MEEKRQGERRKQVLSEEDIELLKDRLVNEINARVISDIIETILQEKNIDKFAEKFEERWRNYFYRGLGKGLVAYAYRGMIALLFVLAGYGMAKDWKFWN